MYFFAPPTYWNEMKTIQTEGSEKGTGKERVESWKAGWRMFLDHPIIGVGALNFGVWFAEYFPERSHMMWGRVAHSLYFTLIPEMGIIGTLFSVGCFTVTVKIIFTFINSAGEKINFLKELI